jgi:hypothetical protein
MVTGKVLGPFSLGNIIRRTKPELEWSPDRFPRGETLRLIPTADFGLQGRWILIVRVREPQSHSPFAAEPALKGPVLAVRGLVENDVLHLTCLLAYAKSR